MRAIVAEQPGGPEVLQLVDRPVPTPGAGQALVQVAYTSLNPLDTHGRAMRVEWNAPAFPFTPGYEYVGRVTAVGAGVDVGLIDQRVSVVGQWGGCADYALADAARVHPVPPAFSWQLGAVYFTTAYSAWHVLHTAGRLKSGDHVLLHSAAGALGTMMSQIAREAGATVYGLCGSADKVAFAQAFGAHHLIDSSAVDPVATVLALSGGRGVDLIIDGVAGPEAPRNFAMLAPLGQVIYVGAVNGTPPTVDISRQLYAKSIAVRGFVVYVAMAQTKGAELPAIHEALATGRWTIPITAVFDLAETAEVHRRFEARALRGRTLIRCGGDL